MRKLLLRCGTTVAICLAVLIAPSSAFAANRGDSRDMQIRIRDDCDPTTFNNIGLGNICIGNGQTMFAKFANQVMSTGRAPQWRFNPDTVHIGLGDSFTATNGGGEVHSFTEVAHFGPSVIPQVNDLLHMPGAQPNTECADGFARLNLDPAHNDPQLTSFVLPGQSFKDTPEAAGTELYQCCIHPWMQAVITIRQDNGDVTR